MANLKGPKQGRRVSIHSRPCEWSPRAFLAAATPTPPLIRCQRETGRERWPARKSSHQIGSSLNLHSVPFERKAALSWWRRRCVGSTRWQKSKISMRARARAHHKREQSARIPSNAERPLDSRRCESSRAPQHTHTHTHKLVCSAGQHQLSAVIWPPMPQAKAEIARERFRPKQISGEGAIVCGSKWMLHCLCRHCRRYSPVLRYERE